MKLTINDTFNKELSADTDLSNTRRQVFDACFSYVTPRVPSSPILIHYSSELAQTLDLQEDITNDQSFLEIFSGAKVLENTQPFAMCYAGHQFGQWAGQLGDGRAINLFEITHQNQQWAFQLKGAGETPYSRTADGLAVLRSSIREHLCSEAMFHLGVPTTRSLSLILTGDEVLRDMMYNGNSAYEQGAVVCRVAPSFIRFGNFQLLSSRNDLKNLKELTDYTIRHFYPNIVLGTKDAYIEFLKNVTEKTLAMVVEWQRVGFVHGVMNTDNMSILGLTIDYGPYGWLEDYDPAWTPNTTDRQYKRYRFGNQPSIALWNLVQLAQAIFPLVEDAKPLEEILNGYRNAYQTQYLAMMRRKIGLTLEDKDDDLLLSNLENVLQSTATDMTIFFRKLSQISKEDNENPLTLLKDAFYDPETLEGKVLEGWELWLQQYTQRLKREAATDEARQHAMNQVNPKYVLRNYMAQIAIDAAEQGDYNIIDELYQLLQNPYAEQPEMEKWFAKRPDWAKHKVGCSMLSCSS
jgi:uncharacterized protein YdiU (UPF0061 family)